MTENTQRVAKVRKRKCRQSRRGVVIDPLSQLPDEILLSILSSLTMMEVARTSVLSKRWRHLWQHITALNFEDSAAMERIHEGAKPLPEERSRFVMAVNHVLKQHLSLAIDELRVVFDLGDSNKLHIDQWVSYALEKQVKRIDLNFDPVGRVWRTYEWANDIWALPKCRRYTLSLRQSHKLASLTSLSLRYVDVSSEAIEVFLQSCPLLVALCVVRSDILTRIRASRFSLTLKHLEISYCPNIKTVDISAPKLLSLKYDGKPIKLHITNASLLSKVHIGGQGRWLIAPPYDSLTEYFSKLKYLCLRMSFCGELNLEPSQVSVMTSLQHLRLHVYADCNQTLLGWTSFIQACPVLERLTIELFSIEIDSPMPIVKCHEPGRPLRCLKTLEILGYVGRKLDLELAYYVLEKAIRVQQVIVDYRPRPYMKKTKAEQSRLKLLKRKLRKGVKLILKQTYPRCPGIQT